MKHFLANAVLLMFPVIGVQIAGAVPVKYTINFTLSIYGGVPVKPSVGSFFYDATTHQFTNFLVQWAGVQFDLTSPANNPVLTGTTGCLNGATGPQATFLFLSAGCNSADREWQACNCPSFVMTFNGGGGVFLSGTSTPPYLWSPFPDYDFGNFTISPSEAPPVQYSYVADGSRVQKFTTGGAYVSQFTTSGGGRFLIGPVGMAIDPNGNFWLTDIFNKAVSKFDSNGNYIKSYGSYGSGNGQFLNGIGGVAADGNGNIWVVDGGNNRVQEFNNSGVYQRQFGKFGKGPGQFQGATAIAIDGAGFICVADSSRVQRFTTTGVYVGQFPINAGGRFPIGAAGMAVDANGNFWLTDIFDKNVSEFDSSGNYINTYGSYGSGNGQFLNGIEGVAADGNGNIWVVDGGHNRVEEFNSSGVYQNQFGKVGKNPGQFQGAIAIVVQ